MVNIDINLLTTALCLIAGLLALIMLLSRSAITSALSLLGVLLATGGIYGLLNEHFVAAIQLVVYAGAIMVLFVFSIMLLNLDNRKAEIKAHKATIAIGTLSILSSFAVVVLMLRSFFKTGQVINGPYSAARIQELGGNTRALAQELFSSHHILFEVASLALLIAIVAAVVLAKRKFD